MRVSQLWVYPIKSCRGIRLESTQLLPEGIQHDRIFCVVQIQKRSRRIVAVDQRQKAALSQIEVTFQDDHLIASVMKNGLNPDVEDITLPIDEAAYHTCDTLKCNDSVKNKWWGKPLLGKDCGDKAAQFFSTVINSHENRKSKEGNFRLVRFVAASNRRTRDVFMGKSPISRVAQPEDTAAFADLSALHLVTMESLANLNDRLEQKGSAPVEIQRFRANIVLEGAEKAFAEDDWGLVTVGENHELRVHHGTGRCTIPNVNQETMKREQVQEPYNTLKSFRPAPFGYGKHGGPEFGLWLASTSYECLITVGDKVRSTAKSIKKDLLTEAEQRRAQQQQMKLGLLDSESKSRL